MQVVYQKQENVESVLEAYASTLREAGAEVVELVPSGRMECPLRSQLTRLFAFRRPDVRPDDVVVTADVNLFPVSPDILEPIEEFPNMQVWVPQYHDTVYIEEASGEKGPCTSRGRL